jgi:hypothetical protein
MCVICDVAKALFQFIAAERDITLLVELVYKRETKEQSTVFIRNFRIVEYIFVISYVHLVLTQLSRIYFIK